MADIQLNYYDGSEYQNLYPITQKTNGSFYVNGYTMYFTEKQSNIYLEKTNKYFIELDGKGELTLKGDTINLKTVDTSNSALVWNGNSLLVSAKIAETSYTGTGTNTSNYVATTEVSPRFVIAQAPDGEQLISYVYSTSAQNAHIQGFYMGDYIMSDSVVNYSGNGVRIYTSTTGLSISSRGNTSLSNLRLMNISGKIYKVLAIGI